MEELTQSWSGLSLNDREGSKFILKNQLRSSEFIIAAKFLTKRVLNMEAVARTFRQLWRSTDGFKIRNLGDHVVLFVFKNQADVNRIFLSEPWCFDKHLVVLQNYDSDASVSDLSFNRATFWVQVHNIPIRFMSKEVVEGICDTIRDVCRSIGGMEEDGGMFMRVKVNLDISLPLCQGRLVSFKNGKKTWVSFKYERLPNICYWCGRLDHSDKDCSLWINSKGTLSPSERQYSQNLRAPPYRSYNKPIVFVPGFSDTFVSPSPRGEFEEEDRLDVAVENPSSSSPAVTSPGMEMDTNEVVINANVDFPKPGLPSEPKTLVENISIPNIFPSSASLSRNCVDANSTLNENSAYGGVNQEESDLEKNPEIFPKNTSPFAAGDPFLAKLHEINCDIRKFDNVLGGNPGVYNTVECDMGREGVPQAHGVVQDGPDPSTMLFASSSQKKGATSFGPTISTKPKLCERAKSHQKSKLPKPVPMNSDEIRERPPIETSDTQPQKKKET